MNSTESLVARQYRLQQWADPIFECQNRSAGVSVKECCSQQEVTATNYYYRLREVNKDCLANISCDPIPQSIVPVSAQLISDHLPSTSGLEVLINNVCIRVTNQTSSKFLKMVLQVAADVK